MNLIHQSYEDKHQTASCLLIDLNKFAQQLFILNMSTKIRIIVYFCIYQVYVIWICGQNFKTPQYSQMPCTANIFTQVVKQLKINWSEIKK